jgi:hypothetical protein
MCKLIELQYVEKRGMCVSGEGVDSMGLLYLKVHKIEIFFGFDFEICIISLLCMSKY